MAGGVGCRPRSHGTVTGVSWESHGCGGFTGLPQKSWVSDTFDSKQGFVAWPELRKFGFTVFLQSWLVAIDIQNASRPQVVAGRESTQEMVNEFDQSIGDAM